MLAGFGAIAIGVISLQNQERTTRSFNYQYVLTMRKADTWKETQRTITETLAMYQFLFVMTTAGTLSLLLGWVLYFYEPW